MLLNGLSDKLTPSKLSFSANFITVDASVSFESMVTICGSIEAVPLILTGYANSANFSPVYGAAAVATTIKICP